jgi:hypothetical protein
MCSKRSREEKEGLLTTWRNRCLGSNGTRPTQKARSLCDNQLVVVNLTSIEAQCRTLDGLIRRVRRARSRPRDRSRGCGSSTQARCGSLLTGCTLGFGFNLAGDGDGYVSRGVDACEERGPGCHGHGRCEALCRVPRSGRTVECVYCLCRISRHNGTVVRQSLDPRAHRVGTGAGVEE